MNSKPYDFRQFQAELAALDQGRPEPEPAPKPEPEPEARPEPKAKPLGKKAAEAARVARAREEFLVLRERYQLSVADVVAFFPEEEGIAYLQQLLVASEKKPRRRKTPAE
ncbi:2-hydroxyacyl-CoA dehydratase [Rhodanobacter sp. DHG33]|uniref:2-hydroxyacyl-CoA dehydratase n=1 Tax=Rhodanobacter sp. DHG33 TaxID=2775921 RepID=UPI0017848D0B|nr:2-hydroxyacyl-CoA dehydratase [Rhodanobacter sp. DHG33]MBD8899913.1 2-hydroxyacyl-CoA dehydratase [Rhodanobacter sp. DHG33]